MKKIISAVAFATVATGAWAQVPELGDVLGELSTTELDAFNTELDTAVEPMLDIDLDISIDIAVVNEALSQGLISEQEASDLGSALAVIEENAGYFNFDFEEFIADSIASGDVSAAEIASVMQVFSQLPSEAKAIIGDESFMPFTGLLCSSVTANGCDGIRNQALVTAIGDDDLADKFFDEDIVFKSNPGEFVDGQVATDALIEVLVEGTPGQNDGLEDKPGNPVGCGGTGCSL